MKIKRKKLIGKSKVYDISVNETESYILENGVVSHNSGPAYGSSIIISMNKSKEKEDKEVVGSGMTCTNNKNRFAKENASIKLLIHYDHGLNRFSGLFEIALEVGYITQPKSGFYVVEGDSKQYRRKDLFYNEEMWMKALNGSFGDSLNKKFKYQSQTSDLFVDDEDGDNMEE